MQLRSRRVLNVYENLSYGKVLALRKNDRKIPIFSWKIFKIFHHACNNIYLKQQRETPSI